MGDPSTDKSYVRPVETVALAPIGDSTEIVLDASDPAALAGLRGSGAASRRSFSIALLLRFKWTILAVFVLSVGIALPVIWLVIKPTYVSRAVLEVRSLVPRLVATTEETGHIPQYQRYLRSQVEIMKNPVVLERVLSRGDVQQTNWYRDPVSRIDQFLGTPGGLMQRLSEMASATSIHNTELIEIAVTAAQPRDAKVLADALLEEYLRFSSERLSEEDKQLFHELCVERDKLQAAIGFSRRMVADARQELRTTSPDELIAQRRIRLDQLEAELEALDEQIAVAQYELGEAESVAATTQPDGMEGDGVAVFYEDDNRWLLLNDAVREAQDAVDSAKQRFGPQADAMIRARQVLVNAQAALAEREEQLDRLAARGMLVTPTISGEEVAISDPRALRLHIKQLEFQRELRQKSVTELSQSFGREFSTAQSLHDHADDLQKSTDRLKAVQSRLYELDEKGRIPATIRPISRASMPAGVDDDRRMKLSLAAVLGGLVLGLGCVYLRLVLSPQVFEVEEVRKSANGAFLGYIPLRQRNTTPTLARIEDESVRIVRTSLLNRLTPTGGNVVCITSAGVGSGKSSLSTMLGRSLARCGKSVLLVDADLHRPSLARSFEVEPTPGLVNLLANSKTQPLGIRKTETPNLDLLPAGKWNTEEELELLTNGAFTSLLDEWRRRYDIVVLDSPPLLVTADAVILSRHADGVVMVARERHCRRAALTEALAVLSASGATLLGTVFVGSERTRGYGYSYYAYGED